MNVKINNSGPATTLHKWELVSKFYPKVATFAGTNMSNLQGWDLVEIGAGQIRAGSIGFRIKAPMDQVRQFGNEWRVEWFDVAGQHYNAPIPEQSYRMTD